MKPPTVIYPFVAAGDRPVQLSSFEEMVFTVSLIYSRFHFMNATLVADEPWMNYLKSLRLFGLFTRTVLIKPSYESALNIFWSTEAKRQGLVAALANPEIGVSEDSPVLLMDADCIIFNPSYVLDWSDPVLRFAGGYFEPLTWEAYREQPFRFASLTDYVWNEVRLKVPPSWAALPVNGGCLYFQDAGLCATYVNLLDGFMGKFCENGCTPRPYYKDVANPTAGTTFFSEVMMADQRLLGMLLENQFGRSRLLQELGPVRMFTTFKDTSEYPEYTPNFLHLWKLKAELNRNLLLQAMMRQKIFESVQKTFRDHSFLTSLGFLLYSEQLPMTTFPVLHLVHLAK